MQKALTIFFNSYKSTHKYDTFIENRKSLGTFSISKSIYPLNDLLICKQTNAKDKKHILAIEKCDKKYKNVTYLIRNGACLISIAL